MVARNRQCGNTFVEVVIVVAIIGITASIGIPRFQDSIERTKFTSTIADMNTMGDAWLAHVATKMETGDVHSDFDHGDTIPEGLFLEIFFPEILARLGKTAKELDHWGHPFHFGICNHGYLLQCSGGQLGPITDYVRQCIGPISMADDRVPLRRIIIVNP